MLSTLEIPYEVRVFTGDKHGADTDANVFLKIYGSKGKDSGKQDLGKSNNVKRFQRNQVDLIFEYFNI